MRWGCAKSTPCPEAMCQRPEPIERAQRPPARTTAPRGGPGVSRCIMGLPNCAGTRVILTVCGLPAEHPGIQLRAQRVHRAPLVVQMPMHRHPLTLLPALDSRHVAAQVGRNFFPGIQPLFCRFVGKRHFKGRFTHRDHQSVRGIRKRSDQIVPRSTRTAKGGI